MCFAVVPPIAVLFINRHHACVSMSLPPPPCNFPSLTEKEKELNAHSTESTLKDVFDRRPAELVDVALTRLQEAGVELIEWKALLYRRMAVPIIVKASGLIDLPLLEYPTPSPTI